MPIIEEEKNINLDRPLMAYAYLAQTGTIQGDILSGLVPILSPIARSHAGQEFDVAVLSKEIEALYGIDVHPWVIEELIPRLEREQIIYSSKLTKDAVKYYYNENQAALPQDITEEDIAGIIESYVIFCAPHLQRNQVEIDNHSLEKHFLEQLVSLDFHLSLVRPKHPQKNTEILTLKRAKEKEDEPEVEKNSSGDILKVLSASFILYCYEHEKNDYALLVRITTGAVLAEFILNIQDPGSDTSLKGTKFVLDAPLVMSLMDLTNQDSHAYAKALTEKLKEKGAILCIFRHSADEIIDNLRAVKSLVENGAGYGSTARRMRSASFKKYVETIIADIDGILQRLGITVINSVTTESTYFTEAQYQELYAALNIYNRQTARSRDTLSVASILRLRRGQSPTTSQFQRCGYILITENLKLAKISSKFLVDWNILRKNHVPAAVTDRYMAGMALVLFGAKSATDIAQKRLLANCATALEPSSDLLEKTAHFLEATDENQASQFRALMTTERGAQYLSVITLGNPIYVNNTESAERVLTQLKDKIEEELSAEYKEKQELIVAQHASALSEAEQEAENLKSQLEEAVSEAHLASVAAQENETRANTIFDLLVDNERKDLNRQKGALVDLLERSQRKIETRKKILEPSIVIVATVLSAAITFLLVDDNEIAWLLIVAAATALISHYITLSNFDKLFPSYWQRKKRLFFRELVEENHFAREAIENFEIDVENHNVMFVGTSLDEKYQDLSAHTSALPAPRDIDEAHPSD